MDSEPKAAGGQGVKAIRFSASAAILASAALLLTQAWLTARIARERPSTEDFKLNDLPNYVGSWQSTGDNSAGLTDVEQAGADENLNRTYQSSSNGLNARVSLAYYRSQEGVKQQYDMEEYLPEEGWSRQSTEILSVLQPGSAGHIRSDLYCRGPECRLVLRWFENRRRTLADSYRLHLYRALDSLRGDRTDLLMVQIVTPVPVNELEQASKETIGFAQEVNRASRSLLFSH